ncbi:hypothetical protein SODALDRAFT_57332 [Sodiomyces alkalinus F11]|uniref:Uncharacterized protein n=1 Tax=Sodiomyces alkalinus (strain CBS 110278 / VKM F-3762 / F11) TaxID=1314773 RepID=A0A3N2PNK1_SODAK|nr:hypothetical protein SODALDRAFT_57332 [Sodiomyces alkalinus F11]ROT36063.1 hypothetical protein SODALDRAFT_57332 [Sodiomyces alkalinus F11]
MDPYNDAFDPLFTYDPTDEQGINFDDHVPESQAPIFLEDWNFMDASNNSPNVAQNNEAPQSNQEQYKTKTFEFSLPSPTNSLFDDVSPKATIEPTAGTKVSPKLSAADPSAPKQKPQLSLTLPPLSTAVPSASKQKPQLSITLPPLSAVIDQAPQYQTDGQAVAETEPQVGMSFDAEYDLVAQDFLTSDTIGATSVDPAHLPAIPIDPALMEMYKAEVPQALQVPQISQVSRVPPVPATKSRNMMQGTVDSSHYSNSNSNNNHTGISSFTSLGNGFDLGWNNSSVQASYDIARYPTPEEMPLSAWPAPPQPQPQPLSLPLPLPQQQYVQPTDRAYTPPVSHAPSRVPTPLPNASAVEAPAAAVPERIPRQRKQCQTLDFAQWYEPLPAAPAAWGGKDPLRPKFTYTRSGEWAPSVRLSRDDVLEYMVTRKQTGQPLRIWIQNMPAGCNNRNPTEASRRCRWTECPAKSGTILKGWWRVAFDERPGTSGTVHDPFHNAGYMHLFCFESCFDLIEVVSSFDVRPDTRHLAKEERNPMALTRDHGDLLLDWERWRASQTAAHADWARRQAERTARGLPLERRQRRDEDHLWYELTTAHMAKESTARQAVRDRRGGLSLDKHKGDLAKYCRMKAEAYRRTRREQEEARKLLARHKQTTAAAAQGRQHQRQQSHSTSPTRVAGNKRSRENDDGDDDGEWTPTTSSKRPRGGEEASPTSPTQRAAKRRRGGDSTPVDEVIVIPDEPESPRRSRRLGQLLVGGVPKYRRSA